MSLRIMQFNLENLFSRYALIDQPQEYHSVHVGIVGVTNIDYNGRPLCEATTQIQRNNTAQAILDCQPDLMAAEEVENLWTLRCFNDQYLAGYFGMMILIEGNDARGIDVGLCIREGCPAAVVGIRSHVEEPVDGAPRVKRYYDEARGEITVEDNLFSRDCLEVDVDAGGTPLTFLVNHFKAQASGQQAKAADTWRAAQAQRVAELVHEVKARGRKPVVLGDLNEDWNPAVPHPKKNLSALKTLVDNHELSDPFGVDAPYPWTHFYGVTGETSRLDYILVDSSLPVTDHSIFRKGITRRCAVAGDRYPTVGQVGTEASDHCPVVVTLGIAGSSARTVSDSAP